ncbi:MAG TPA: NPCBM/NEW2 domain-containing protein [Tepidisphaeraceae bacterium]|nr:NPCBM/NEW2 domain-containing protein [Tepidisphaeraceae bacterium]
MNCDRRSRRSALRKVCRAAFDVLESRTLFTVAVPQVVPRIMPLGDSITQAFGGHASYRYWLWNELADAGYTVDLVGSQQPPGVADGEPLFLNFDPHHEGHSGWTADEIAAMTQDQNWIDYTLLPQNNPDIVLLHIGTNDINHGETNESTIDDISTIIDGLRNVNPNVKILLAKIIPGDGIEDAVQDLNSLMPALVAAKSTDESPITLIDQYTGFDVDNDLYDGVHPSESGEKKIAQNWYNALTSLLPAPTTPDEGVYIDTLVPTSSLNGWGPVEYELSNGESNQFDGQMISLGGKKYMRGLGVNSDSDISYDITGKHYTNFLADIGLDDEVAENGTVQFKIVVDGNVLFDSGLLTGESDIQSINVAIPEGSQTLELVVTDGGDDSSFDHADWANARVLVADEVPAPEAPDLDGQLNGQQVDLSWTEATEGITSYHIERKTGDGDYETLADLSGDELATTYSDTTVQPGQTYHYRVSANNGTDSEFSNEFSVDVPEQPTAPAAPDLSGQLNGSKIDLSWTDSSNDVTSYHIERKTGSGGTYTTLVDLTGVTFATAYSDTTIEEGKTYYYRVSASNDVGPSDFSNEVNVAVPVLAPQAPSLNGQLVGQQINLSWTEASQNVNGFKVERKVGTGGTYQQIADLTGFTSFADINIQTGKTYYYHVFAYNSAGPSVASNEISIAVNSQSVVYLSDLNYVVNSNGYGPAEKDKSNGEAAAGDGHTLTLNGTTYTKGIGVHAGSEIVYNLNGQYTQFLSDVGIDDEKGNLGSVNFQVYLDNVIAFDSGKMTGASATQSINLNITGKTTLKLVVTNGGDNIDNDHGDWANARLVAGQPVTPPTDPSNLNALFNSNTNKIDLTWTDAANDATGFRIERKIGANGTYSQIADLLIANLSTLTYSDANVSAGNTYYYHIYAYNAGTNSGLSNETHATYPVPAGSNYLSDLNYTVISNGYGSVEKDKSNAEQPAGDGRTITLNTVTYSKGLGVHAASEVDFNLNGLYTQFLSDIGVDDEVGTAGSVVFQVYLDNSSVPVFDSGKMTGTSLTQSININVTGKSLLRLVVTNAGDNNNYDHADWANARLVSGEPILPPSIPGNFNAQYNSSTNRVDLSWTDAANDATGFRIERKTGANGSYSLLADLTGPTFALGYSDSTISPGVTYTYHVYAYSNNGNSDMSNESTVQVPIVSGTVYLSDMPIVINSNGYGPVELDHSNGEAGTSDGHTLTLNGATFNKGLGVHAGSQITVSLNKQYTQFLANIGVDDEVGNNGSVVFQVWLDNVKVFDSGTMTGQSVTQSININVANKNTMQLIVTDNGNGNAYDHADWANARLVAGQQILTPSAPTGVQAQLNGNQVDISWSAGSNNQTGFRVQRKTGVNGAWSDLQTLGASTFTYSDTGPLAHSTTYYYRVIAFNAVGDSQPSAEQPVTTNEPTVQVWVSDLTPTSSTNGWGPVEIDRSNGEAGTGDGHIMSIRGNTYLKGLGVHGLSQITYSLGGQYTTFLSDIGIDDETGGKGTVVFQVFVDNVLKFDSGTVRGTDPLQQVIVDVTNAQTLTLVVTNANDGANYDHADWANAQLVN